MRTLRRQVLHFALFGLVFMIPSSTGLLADPIVSIQPISSTVQAGSLFDLVIDISSASDLFAFQFDLSFNPTVLAAQSVTEGALLPSGGSTFFDAGTIDNIAGTISFVVDTLAGTGPGVSNPAGGTLATVNFQALANGSSPVSLSNILLLDSTLRDIPFTTKDASVNSVPEPGSILLLVGVLASMLLVRSRSLLHRAPR